MSKDELKNYAAAGAVAEEALTAVRTVLAFGGSKKATQNYESKLEKSRVAGIKKGCLTGLIVGLIFGVFYSCNYQFFLNIFSITIIKNFI